MINKTFTWFSITLSVCITLKILYAWAAPEDMQVVLEPTVFLLRHIFDTPAIVYPGQVFLKEPGILLTKYACGANFYILCFFILSATVPYHRLRNGQAVLAMMGVACTTFILSIFVNVTRITFIALSQKTFQHIPLTVPAWFMRMESVCIHLFFLAICFFLFKNTVLRYFQVLHANHKFHF